MIDNKSGAFSLINKKLVETFKRLGILGNQFSVEAIVSS